MCGILCVFISCVLFIHLGLSSAICGIIKRDFIILKCPKCLTFWCTLAYSVFVSRNHLCTSLAIAFILSYAALWLDLLLEKIYAVYEKEYDGLDTDEKKENGSDGQPV